MEDLAPKIIQNIYLQAQTGYLSVIMPEMELCVGKSEGLTRKNWAKKEMSFTQMGYKLPLSASVA
jgi:hypothetical protein